MNEITKSNLDKRIGHLKMSLGTLAYERQDHALAIERIDKQVAQMEAQGVVLEATLKDLTTDEQNEAGRLALEKANAKKARSERAKAAAKKGKGKTAKKASREGKAAATS